MIFEPVGKVSESSTFVGENVNKTCDWTVLSSVLNSPLRAGIFFKVSERGVGNPIVDMGELFSFDRIESTNGFELVPVDFQKTPRLRLEFNDILFARVSMASEAGKVSIVKLSNNLSTHSDKAIRANINTDKMDPDFLFYFLLSPIGTALISSLSEKTAASSIRKSDLEKLPIPCPPLPIQVAIGSILSSIDDLISELNEQSNTLNEIISSFFKSWFIVFEPVKDKIEGKQPFGVDKETTEIFPDSFEDSRLGPIPTGWKVGNMSEHCESIHKMVDGPFGSNLKSSDYTDSGVRLIHQENVKEFRFDNSRIRYTSEFKSNELSRHSAIPGDLVLTKMPEPICRAAVVPNIAEKFTIMADIIRIRPNPNLPISYLLNLVNSKQFRLKSEAWASGSTRERVTLGTFRKIPTVIPCKTVLVAFGKKCDPLVEQTLLNEQKISTLQRLRDTLLPRLMSGELSFESLED